MTRKYLMAAVLALSGCDYLPPIVIPTPPPTTQPASPTPTPTAEPTPTPTPEPTDAPPSPIPSPSPSPSAPPSPPAPSAAPGLPPQVPGNCSKDGLGVVRVGIGSGGGEGQKRRWHCTYRFGTGAGQNGKPCDGAHLACDDPNYHGQGQCEPCHGNVCEPTNGCEWTASGGLQLMAVEDSGYAAVTKGAGKLTACPVRPVKARYTGENVPIHGTACSSVTVQ